MDIGLWEVIILGAIGIFAMAVVAIMIWGTEHSRRSDSNTED